MQMKVTEISVYLQLYGVGKKFCKTAEEFGLVGSHRSPFKCSKKLLIETVSRAPRKIIIIGAN